MRGENQFTEKMFRQIERQKSAGKSWGKIIEWLRRTYPEMTLADTSIQTLYYTMRRELDEVPISKEAEILWQLRDWVKSGHRGKEIIRLFRLNFPESTLSDKEIVDTAYMKTERQKAYQQKAKERAQAALDEQEWQEATLDPDDTNWRDAIDQERLAKVLLSGESEFGIIDTEDIDSVSDVVAAISIEISQVIENWLYKYRKEEG